MDQLTTAVEHHYGTGRIMQNIMAAMQNAGKDLGNLTLDDLAPVDEFHIRGREGTMELAGLVPLKPGTRVLDVGCGIGGSSRYLAITYKCKVTGVDLTHEFVHVAAKLSHMIGLDGSIDYQQGSALDLPFEDKSFDVSWTQHVQMNIADKHKFYAEMARVLVPGGRLVFHDIFRGPSGDPHYPVPWADDPSISSLVTPDTALEICANLGLRKQVWEDTTQKSLAWIEMMASRPPAPDRPGLNVLMEAATKVKMGNIIRSLKENRLAVIQAVWQK